MVLGVIFGSVAGLNLGSFFSQFAIGRTVFDYGQLRGLPDSFAKEAGERALQGKVEARSKDGWSVATFAGGCFWGTELHFQRIPGVISTCVGYTQGKLGA